MIRLVSARLPRARNTYRCLWCGQDIVPGETYARMLIKHHKVLEDQHWHTECIEHVTLIGTDGAVEFDPYQNNRPQKDVLAWTYPF